MAWLLRDGEVLASIEVAGDRRARARGLLGRPGFAGALLLEGTRSVHSFGMQFPIDVALCDRDLVVRRTVRLVPGRLTRPSLRGGHVIEAEAGCFAAWELCAGDRLEVQR